MEFPFGHHHRRNDEDDYPPPPPSFPQHHNHHHQNDFPPPPLQPDYRDQQPFHPNQAEIQHHYHQNPSQQEPNYGYPPPPQQQQPDYGYPPPQQSGYSSTTTHHVSHEVNYPRYEPEFQHENRDHNYNRHDYHSRPENQTVIHHHSHESGGGGGGSELLNKPTVRVYCKAEPNYSLAIRDGKVILARSDPSDLSQHWIKDEKYSVRVKDEEGSPSFALINKATVQAMKHSVGATHPVQLRHYNQNELDESVLWAESKDTGEGYRCIRMINNIRLNLDAFHGDKNSGGVHDGTILVLWEWLNGENQRWKIVRY